MNSGSFTFLGTVWCDFQIEREREGKKEKVKERSWWTNCEKETLNEE